MYLRNILLFFSLTIIGFALSLYFQTEQTVQTVNWDQFTNLSYNDDRSHSLKDMNEKIVPFTLQEIIQEKYDRNKLLGEKTRVMEIGPGNGRVLMELKKRFPKVEFYGINKEKTHTFYRRESFILTSLKFEIFNKLELEDIDLPYMLFLDLDFGNRIPYEANKFDLIYSQNVLRHFKYKFEFFNEIFRVLKPHGVSFHTDVPAINIYEKGLVINLRDAVPEFRRRGIDFKILDNPASIRFKKGTTNVLFPLTPHQPIPNNIENVPQELRRPEMGYNLTY